MVLFWSDPEGICADRLAFGNVLTAVFAVVHGVNAARPKSGDRFICRPIPTGCRRQRPSAPTITKHITKHGGWTRNKVVVDEDHNPISCRMEHASRPRNPAKHAKGLWLRYLRGDEGRDCNPSRMRSPPLSSDGIMVCPKLTRGRLSVGWLSRRLLGFAPPCRAAWNVRATVNLEAQPSRRWFSRVDHWTNIRLSGARQFDFRCEGCVGAHPQRLARTTQSHCGFRQGV